MISDKKGIINMKKYSKFLAGVLAVLLSAGSTGLYAVANKDENKADTKADSSSSNADDSSEKDGYKSPEIHKREKKSDNSSESENGDVTRKEETVYVLTDANGKPTKTIVSDHLVNPTGAQSLLDASILNEIENVKTDDGFTGSSDSMTWDAKGGDIYYK